MFSIRYKVLGSSLVDLSAFETGNFPFIGVTFSDLSDKITFFNQCWLWGCSISCQPDPVHSYPMVFL